MERHRPRGAGGRPRGRRRVLFLAGIIVRQVREPAIQRLAGVAWFLSVAGVAGAVWLALYHVYGKTDAVTAVAVGAGVTLYAAALWLLRRSALQSLALFAGLVITILGVADIITVPAGTGLVPAPAPNLPTPVLPSPCRCGCSGWHGRGSGGGGTSGPCG